MKTALKYCAIATTIASMIILVIFFFFSTKRISKVTLFDGDLVKGFKGFLNGVFYPTGFMILFLVFLFFGITAVIFMFGEDRNRILHITSGVSSILMFFWFLLLLVNGKRYFNKTNYGYDSIGTKVVTIYKSETAYSKDAIDLYNAQVMADHPTDYAYYLKNHTDGTYDKIKKNEKTVNADWQVIQDAIDANDTMTKEGFEKFYELNKLGENDLTEDEKAWLDANSEYYVPYITDYESYVSDLETLTDNQTKYKKGKKGMSILAPYFFLSFVCLVAGATTIAWVFTKEDRD